MSTKQNDVERAKERGRERENETRDLPTVDNDACRKKFFSDWRRIRNGDRQTKKRERFCDIKKKAEQ